MLPSALSEMLVDGLAGLSRFVELMRIEPDLQDKPNAVELKAVSGRFRGLEPFIGV